MVSTCREREIEVINIQESVSETMTHDAHNIRVRDRMLLKPDVPIHGYFDVNCIS